MRLKPDEIYALMPREYTLLMHAETAHLQDTYEFEAQKALIREQAHRAKSPKLSDLYRHPDRAKVDEEKAEQARQANEWLAQFDLGGKEGD